VNSTVRSVRSSVVTLALLLAALVLIAYPISGFGQEHLDRKVKSRVYPAYPEIARKMSLTGVVKLEVVVSPTGNVKETKVIGGHPILVSAAVDAVKKWKFDPGNGDTTETLEFRFDPNN